MSDLVPIITHEVRELLRERGVSERRDLSAETSLIADVGLDSLAFVDLTFRLEAKLGLRELPLQDWIDAESMKVGRQHTIGSLSEYTNSVREMQSGWA
jgi:acyl carrier protein